MRARLQVSRAPCAASRRTITATTGDTLTAPTLTMNTSPTSAVSKYIVVRLREALDDLLHHWALGGSEDGLPRRINAAHDALRLADAAGIKEKTT